MAQSFGGSSSFNPNFSAKSQSPLSLYFSNVRGFIGIAAVIVATIIFRLVFSHDFIANLLSHPLAACTWDLFWAFMFVGSIYFWKYEEAWSPALRDKLHVVWHRFTSITVVCACFVYLTPMSWSALGLPSSIFQNLASTAIGLILPAVLYTGPIVYAIFAPEDELITWPSYDWLSFRNNVFAPIMEEIAFRMCMIPIMLHAGFSQTEAIFITPLFFGAAHVHHVLNDTGKVISLQVAGKKINIRAIYIAALVQATYTSVFGFFASYLFIRTGTIIAPIMAHAFCNYLGLPPTDFLSHPKGMVIAAAYVVGLVGFFVLMGPLTAVLSPL